MEGQTISHYRVLARLGGGAMGVVYRAEDTRLKRVVALKFLPPELTADPDARERFVQEAQAASALDHPNICTIHDADGDAGGRLFIAMAYYEGASLKERLASGPLPVSDALDYGLQIARGLDKAHQAGIVHRDIKPANLMVTNDGLVKIVDFGIAKLLDRTGPTRTGTTVGTVAYMAPEQIEGKSIDRRVDLWALGVVLFEMLTGQRPFGGENELAVIRNILDATPSPARTIRPDIPIDLERLLVRALTKDPGSRFQTAGEFIAALTECLPSSTAAVTAAQSASASPRAGRRLIAVAVLVAVFAIGGTAAWFMSRASEARRLEALLGQASTLADADDYAPALAALEEAERLAPADTRLPALAARISDTRNIVTTPAGAAVSVRRYDDVTGAWKLLGRTPMNNVRLGKDVFRWKIELAGYEPLEVIGPSIRPFPPLVKAGQYPPDTILIGPGPVTLTLTGYNYSKQFPAGAFLIDKFEVTNRQYKAFVDTGGYTRREYWRHEILRDGRPVPWEQAMSDFRDRTGRPGPATWEAGTYPAGQDNHPVTGVSWYEADAFAAFSRRSLPTVYHWARASGVGGASYISPLSNLNGKGPAPVGSFPGVSTVGAFDMAGNVKEWCANEVHGASDRYILGGSWRDAVHMFYFADARAPIDRSDDNGFRLATYLEQPPAATLTDPVPVPARDFTGETPAVDQMFSAYSRLYAYDPRPLEARVEARDESAPDWIREKVSFQAAYGSERVVAYVFLPKHVQAPYQTIVYAPAASAVTNRTFDTGSGADFNSVDYLIRSGRAVVYPVYSGTYERNTGRTSVWPEPTRAFQDWLVQVVMDGRRTVDYLESRDDIRRDSLAFLGASWGASFAPRFLALEKRFKAAVITDGGFSAAEILPELDIFNYVPRVTLPLLMINGDGDFIYPVDTAQRPFFELLGTPRDQKRKVTLPGGHYIIQLQRNQVIREVLDWLDQHAGRVEAPGPDR